MPNETVVIQENEYTVTVTGGDTVTVTSPSSVQVVSVGTQGPPGASGPNNITTATTTDLTGYLKGNGSVVSASTTVPAADLTGTIADARLSSNIPRLNVANTWTIGPQTVNRAVSAYGQRTVDFNSNDGGGGFPTGWARLVCGDPNVTLDVASAVGIRTSGAIQKIWMQANGSGTITSPALVLNTDAVVSWGNAHSLTSFDVGLKRNAAGVLRVTNGTTGDGALMTNSIKAPTSNALTLDSDTAVYFDNEALSGVIATNIFTAGQVSAGGDITSGGSLSVFETMTVGSSVSVGGDLSVSSGCDIEGGLSVSQGRLNVDINTGAILLASVADSAAPNSSLYFSTDSSKPVWKDSGGVTHVLY